MELQDKPPIECVDDGKLHAWLCDYVDKQRGLITTRTLRDFFRDHPDGVCMGACLATMGRIAQATLGLEVTAGTKRQRDAMISTLRSNVEAA